MVIFFFVFKIIFPVLVLVGAGLVLELQVRLRVIEVRGAGQRLRIVGRPVVVLGDLPMACTWVIRR